MDYWTGKRVLVTGGHGFLGSHIVEALRAAKAKVYAPAHTDVDLLQAGETAQAFASFSPTVVIHAAALVGGIGANEARPGDFMRHNLLMGLNVVHASYMSGVDKLVNIGTACSYPANVPTPILEEDLWRGYPEPTNAPYGIAKRAILSLCQAYRQQHGMRAITLIPVNLYGPRDNFDPLTSHVVPAVIRKMIVAMRNAERRITLWGDGSPTREFLYVTDAARGILDAAERYDREEPVNLGSGDEVSIRELSSTVASILGYEGNIVWDGSRPNGQMRRRVDASRAREEFGWSASVDFPDGLRRTIEWAWEHVFQPESSRWMVEGS